MERAARLVLLNGPPGIGKTTLARRYVAECPLALNLDIDDIRRSLGQWESRPESKPLARGLALELARAHLANGYEVVVPQLLLRTEYIDSLAEVAAQARVPFVEVVLLAPTSAEAITRFRRRRADFGASGTSHPSESVVDEVEAVEVSYERLGRIATNRPQTKVLYTIEDDVESSYQDLRRLIDPKLAPTLQRTTPTPLS